MSGGYLGDIVRRVLLRMSEESALFGDILPPKLKTPYILGYLLYFLRLLYKTIDYNNHCDIMQDFPNVFRSPDMAAMHQDISEDRDIVNKKLKEVFGVSIIRLACI